MSFLFLSLIFSIRVFAGVSAYTGTSGQKLFIEEGDKDTFFIKFTGVKSAWENMVIKTTRTGKPDSYRYAFQYILELSSGKHDRTFTIVVDERPTLVAGTIVPQVSLHNQENPRDGMKLTWDKELTDKSQEIKLAEEFKKKPYFPEVD